MQSQLTRDSQIAIAKAISKGAADKNLQKIGLNKRNINHIICESDLLKVKAKSHKPFVETILGPTPLIYAILFYEYRVLVNILRIEGTENEIYRQCDEDEIFFQLLYSTPLHIAVAQNNLNTVFVLLSEGADPNAKNRDGNTPLHLCARIKNINIAQALIAADADFDIKNNHKKTPLSVAKLCKNEELAELIKKIQTNKQKRPNLHVLIDNFLPYLNKISEEEEEEDIEAKKSNHGQNTNKQEDYIENEKNINNNNVEFSNYKLQNENNIAKEDSVNSNETNDDNKNTSFKAYQYILDTLSMLQQRVDNLVHHTEKTNNENNNENQVDSETFNHICDYVNQISDRISNLESYPNKNISNNAQNNNHEHFNSLSDVLDKINNLTVKMDQIDSHPQPTYQSNIENNNTNEEINPESVINEENTINIKSVSDNKIEINNENTNTLNDSELRISTTDNQNNEISGLDKVKVETIKEEFDFDDNEEVESILTGSGACCDVCGDPAIKMCNVCHHKFCQICIGSTKHIEYHLELDDDV